MKGSVIKKGTKWYVIVELMRDPITNKRNRSWSKGFDTKREAESARIEMLNQIQRNEFSKPSSLSLKEFLIDWLENSQTQYKPGTHSVMSRHLKNHVINKIGSVKLQELRTAHLNKLYKELSLNGNLTSGEGLSIKTIKGVHAYLRKALSDAEKWDFISKNPASNAEIPKDFEIKSAGHSIWTNDELTTFLNTSRQADDKYFPLWFFYATTGVRRGEALGLEWTDIYLIKGKCNIRQTIGCVDHKAVFQTPKTKSSRRTIALPSVLVIELKKLKKRQIAFRLQYPGLWNEEYDLVFTHEDGRMLHPERVFKEFQRRSTRYGVKLTTLHSLRHGWATNAGRSGVSPNVMKEHLGHSSITITMDTYSHVLAEQDEAAAELVTDAIFANQQLG